MHTTNYFNTFIEIAPDCPENAGMAPPMALDRPTVANLQFEMILANPYRFTSDEVLFAIHCQRKGIDGQLEQEHEAFFSKGQACLRSSPLPKRYGWGFHFDAAGKVALYAAGTEAYQAFLTDDQVKKVKAMRSKKAD